MTPRPVGRGYVHLEQTGDHPWPAAQPVLKAHEFHYSRLENVAPGLRYAYRVTRGHGIDGAHDGIVHRNLLASYAHLRSVAGDDWPVRFIAFARASRAAQPAALAA
jgi:cobyrinic acid a,c-diamide synthase